LTIVQLVVAVLLWCEIRAFRILNNAIAEMVLQYEIAGNELMGAIAGKFRSEKAEQRKGTSH
jgi:hypothetical protein